MFFLGSDKLTLLECPLREHLWTPCMNLGDSQEFTDHNLRTTAVEGETLSAIEYILNDLMMC